MSSWMLTDVKRGRMKSQTLQLMGWGSEAACRRVSFQIRKRTSQRWALDVGQRGKDEAAPDSTRAIQRTQQHQERWGEFS